MERRISQIPPQPRFGRWALVMGVFLLAVGCHSPGLTGGSSGSYTGRGGGLLGGGSSCSYIACSAAQPLCPIGLHCFDGFCIDALCRKGCLSSGGWTPEEADGGPPPGLVKPCEITCTATGCSNGCLIGGKNYSNDTLEPGNSCEACQPAVSVSQWTPRPAGVSCPNANLCTTNSQCDGSGSCTGTPVACTTPPGICYGSPGTCNPVTGACSYAPLADGTPCGTGCGFCMSGVCSPGQTVFAQQGSYNTGACPTWVAAGDFNSDGKQDLATVNSCDNDVEVFLGNGDGTFQFPTTYTPPNSPKLLWSLGVANSANQATADFNHDGKLDLAVTDYTARIVDILLGNGAGGFTFGAQYPSPASPNSLIAADLNGDGWADLAYSVQFGSAVNVRLNSAGLFGAPSSFGVGPGPSTLATGVFTRGGPPDLATSNAGASSLSVLLNGGGATSFSSQTFSTGNNPQGIASADFNKDGVADLVTADNCDNTVSVLLNNGSGGFPSRSIYSVATGPISVIATDLNGDGYPDLAVASGGGRTLCPGPPNSSLDVLFNNGNGTFAAPLNYNVGSMPFALASADFNGDGRPDLAVVNYQSTSDQLVIMKNVCFFGCVIGGQPFAAGTVEPPGGDCYGCQPNLSTTAWTPLPAGYGCNDHDLCTLNDQCNGSGVCAGTPVVCNTPPNTLCYQPTGVCNLANGVCDYTQLAEGTPCGLGCGFCNATGTCAPGTSTFTQVSSYNTGACPTFVVAGDFNGDGKQDLATVNSCDNDVDLFLGHGDGSFALPLVYQPPNSPKTLWSLGVANSANQTTADFNHDGKLDLALADIGGNVVDLLLGDGTGNFTFGAQYPTGSGPDSIVALDLNNDGWADLAYSQQYANAVTVRLNNQAGLFPAPSNYAVGAAPSIVAPGVFTSGGPIDLATSNAGTTTLSVLLSSAGATAFAASTFATGHNPQGIATGDLTKAGVADLVTADNCDNTVSVLLNNGSAGFPSRTTYNAGTGPIAVITQDFNGDGYPDLAVASGGGWTFCPGPANSALEVMLNNGNGTFGSPQIYSVGSQPFALASADFDGDGRPDLAIVNYQSTSNQLVIMKNVCSPLATPIAGSVPNPLIWLKPGIGVTPSASAIGDWADQSGNGNDFTQTVPSRRPTLVANAVAGYDAVEFASASSQTLTNATNLTAPFSLFYVARELGTQNQRVLNGLANNWFLGFWGGGMNQAYFNGWLTPQGTPATDTAWHLYEATSDGTTAYAYNDGVALAISTVNTVGPNGLSLTCNDGVANDECSDAEVVELLVYGAVLSTSQRQAVEQYMNAKYGL